MHVCPHLPGALEDGNGHLDICVSREPVGIDDWWVLSSFPGQHFSVRAGLPLLGLGQESCRGVDELSPLEKFLLQSLGPVSEDRNGRVRTFVSVEFIVTFPRDRGATKAPSIEAYW